MIAFCQKKWLIQLLGIIALGLLIWFFGALVAFAGYIPLASDTARLLTILIIVLLWGLNNLRCQLQSHRATEQMVADLGSPETTKANTLLVEQTTEEIDLLSQNFNEALQLLKKNQGKNAHGSQYLYDLPWYMLIGPPGSGKTTALLNSGLEFPLADKLGKGAIRGVGGTRHCDWWFTDQAVLLDTAGRYTTQDSHAAVDKAAWSGFLSLLKKHRPRRPLNGVLITLSLTDLLKQTEAERLLHAQTIRQRIDELHEQFGIRIPLYMIFTKGDLIAGFNDFFADLGKDERAQVWGITFAKENQAQPGDVLAQVSSEFDALLMRLQTRLPKRLQEERDLQRRALIFGFPQRIALLKENLLSFLHECYGSNRYQAVPYLRGVYFTSGTQEGTPIDRLMGLLAQTFQLDRVNVPLFSGKGKSYFIARLLSEVIFAESLLVGLNPRLERMQTLLRRGTYALVSVLILSMSAVWFNSYTKNQAAITALSEKIQAYETAAVANPNWQKDFSALVPRMNALLAVATVYADDAPWSMRFGLYQGEKLQTVAQDVYQQMLQKQFLPLIKTRLEQRLRGVEASNPEVRYELLKVYLMLGEPKRLQAGLVRPWLVIDWEKNANATAADLLKHLDNLLKLPLEAQPLNSVLVAANRQILQRIPIAQQLYMRLKSEALQDSSQDFRLSDALAPNGTRVFTTPTGTLEQQTIPYLFTYNGFYQVFLKQSKVLAKESVNENWVLGATAKPEAVDIPKLEQAMQAYYDADYIKAWEALLANLKIKPINTLQDSLEVLQYACASDSPLRQLLLALSKETALTHAPDTLLATANKVKGVGETVTALDSRMLKLLNSAQAVDSHKNKSAPLGSQVELHFKPLTALVKSGAGGTMPFDQTLATLGQLYGYMIDVGSTSNPGGAALKAVQKHGSSGDALAKMKLEAARLPEPLKSMMQVLAVGNLHVMLDSSKDQLNKLWQTEVMPLYASGIVGRYPLVKNSSKELTLEDFSRFFAKNGILDTFFSSNLASFVDTSGENWKLIAENNQTIGITPDVLVQFQYAEKIRQIFFQAAGEKPLVKFNLRPVLLDSGANKFWLNVEGQQTEYVKNGSSSKSIPFQWPGTDASRLVSFGFETVDGRKLRSQEEGVWALFRVLDSLAIQKNEQDNYFITFDIKGLKAIYELSASSVDNPFSFSGFQNIRFPKSLY